MRSLLLLAGLACSANAQSWTKLFDGKSLDGWEARATAGWLATKAAFKNFQLQLEFRGPATVNSGVFLRSQKAGEPHVTGYELQIWDMQPAGYLTGSLVGSVKAQPTKIKPDQWNNFDITANGDHFLVKLNGQTILDARDSKHAEGVIGFQCQAQQHFEFSNIRIKAEK